MEPAVPDGVREYRVPQPLSTAMLSRSALSHKPLPEKNAIDGWPCAPKVNAKKPHSQGVAVLHTHAGVGYNIAWLRDKWRILFQLRLMFPLRRHPRPALPGKAGRRGRSAR
jgi:hypothetical protein